jgi:hypothetical protein
VPESRATELAAVAALATKAVSRAALPVRRSAVEKIREAQLRAVRLEACSVTTAPQWDLPNTSYGGTTFGQITSAGGNRTPQVAAKFYY